MKKIIFLKKVLIELESKKLIIQISLIHLSANKDNITIKILIPCEI